MAKRITQWLHENGVMSKAIVFCVNTDHAQQMRNLLAALDPEEMSRDSRYVMRITGNDPEGREQLDNFISVDFPYPVIATTSQMLTTGVDCKMCKLIVLDTSISSMTVFKQIVGRGTRLLWNDEDKALDKRYFTVMDFRNATRHFADEEFDGEIEVIEEEECPVCHEFPCICDKYEPETEDDTPPMAGGAGGVGLQPPEEEPKLPKPSIIGPEVAPEDEVSWMRPATWLRYSALTGSTKRPSRMVTVVSCRYFCRVLLRTMLLSVSRRLARAFISLRRISESVGLAPSAISSSETIERSSMVSSASFGTTSEKR